jgi:hypothetical protein
VPARFGGLDQRFHQGAAGCASDSLAPLDRQRLALPSRFFGRPGVGDFSFFFGQQAPQSLTPRFVGFDGEEPPIVLDIHMGDGSVHRVAPVLVVPRDSRRAQELYNPAANRCAAMFSGVLTLVGRKP